MEIWLPWSNGEEMFSDEPGILFEDGFKVIFQRETGEKKPMLQVYTIQPPSRFP